MGIMFSFDPTRVISTIEEKRLDILMNTVLTSIYNSSIQACNRIMSYSGMHPRTIAEDFDGDTVEFVEVIIPKAQEPVCMVFQCQIESEPERV